ncbi:hypothetical protein [Psychromonas antarctica]|jgi:hypothetical protein|uniref:hypothetical protein n=1 Tax=Psychromonas antarctica TaxID=67573 RepID=UPI001EE95310|nr:hypothetical protein [Psychromonas antarctica]MCG6200079.1 hypothetical protein [Psychromonas antarctica]
MRNSEQLSLYFANQLPTLLIAHPTFKFIGLKIKQEDSQSALHSIYIEKENISDELPFRSLVTVAEWDGKSEEEEFFLEALTAERLMEKLQHFDAIGSFVFFKIPSSVTMDTVHMYPQAMFCKLFPELGEFNRHASAEKLLALKEQSVALLTGLEDRLKRG